LFSNTSYFRIQGEEVGTSLVYSVGCHSGLSVPESAIVNPSSNSRYTADWVNAILKQGGNLVGNTGYGYGDTEAVAYSEKLALFYTEALGRDLGANNPTLGDSLALAKRRFVESAGAGSFSAFDEKAMLEWTLYGLPGIRAVVPNPFNPSDPPFGGPIEPSARPVLPDNDGQAAFVTRLVTFTNTFTRTILDRGVPIAGSRVDDSFASGNPTFLRGTDLARLGRPVMPSLAYDITVLPTGSGFDAPIPRGIRLVKASAQPLITGFDAHVTTVVTEETYLQQQDDPEIEQLGEWMPDQPYTYERVTRRIAGNDIDRDLLSVTPAQFRSFGGERGDLRLFNQLVFEITYLDPRFATPAQLADQTPPLIEGVEVLQNSSGPSKAAGPSLLLVATVNDDNAGTLEVSVVYTTDGETWQRLPMPYNSAANRYELVFSPPQGSKFVAIIEARDAAGNIASDTAKGELLALYEIQLPLVVR
jgi:hypothetical protein